MLLPYWGPVPDKSHGLRSLNRGCLLGATEKTFLPSCDRRTPPRIRTWTDGFVDRRAIRYTSEAYQTSEVIKQRSYCEAR